MSGDFVVGRFYVRVDDKFQPILVDSTSTPIDIHNQLCNVAGLTESPETVVCKLYTKEEALVGLGSHIPPNTPNTAYSLKVVPCKYAPAKEKIGHVADIAGSTEAAMKTLNMLTLAVQEMTHDVELPDGEPAERTGKPPMRRVQRIGPEVIFEGEPPEGVSLAEIEPPIFPPAVQAGLKHPTFNIWQFSENELMSLIEHMFDELDLMDEFKINRLALRRFLRCVKTSYNKNPFHNFRHCFCVTQMMYGLIHVSGLVNKLTKIEKLTLLIACIGHDLDHPGFNNAYQVNAATELAIVYNDASPLENHHSAVLFTLLKNPETKVLGNLSDADYKEVRKQVINCILATDMAKHGEILAKFKSHADNFNYDDPAQRSLLLQLIVKCSDISNEVRPKEVSEPWVDNLLEEFFGQSDREKEEGLPTAPFMDRAKVTKASAQVGFIGFVMIPLFELVSKVLPNLDEHVIAPIKKALEYYKSLLEKPV